MGDHSGKLGVVDFFENFVSLNFGDFDHFFERFAVQNTATHQRIFGTVVYDHTTLKAPELVRSPKLSNVGPGEY